MPSYQCPRCRNHFSVESDDIAIAECPHCNAADEVRNWFYKIGGETIGPVSREKIDALFGEPIEIRHRDGEWQALQQLAGLTEDTGQPDGDENSTPTRHSPLRVLAILILLAAAVSGWVYHFALIERDKKSPEVADVANGSSGRRKTGSVKSPADETKTVVRRLPKKKVAQPKPRLTAKVENLQMEIQTIDQQPQKVIVRVAVKDPAVWKQVQAMVSPEDLSELISLRELSDRELRTSPKLSKRKRRVLLRRGPDHGPIFGTVRIEGKALLFRPAANLLPGERYIATFDPSVLGPDSGFPRGKIEKLYTVGPARPRLIAIHPLARELPDNFDRFHIIFTEPMQRENALTHLRLRNPVRANEDIDWKSLRPNLHWSKDSRRCTIQFEGKPATAALLKSGVRYRLLVSGEWKSTHGLPLGRDASKFFTVDDSDNSGPQPDKWTLKFPGRSGKQQPIRCKMRELIDWVSWNAEARIVDANGRRVAGNFAFLSGGSIWNFYPAAAWKGGDYRLLIGHRLHDLCGNVVTGKLKPDPTDSKKKCIVIPFHIRDAN